MEKKCLACGAPFEAKYGGRLYCSGRCRDIMAQKRRKGLAVSDWQPKQYHIEPKNEGMTAQDWERFKAAYRLGRQPKVYSQITPAQEMLVEVDVRGICGYGVTGRLVGCFMAGESFLPYAMLKTESQYKAWRAKALASGKLKKAVCQVCGCEFEHIIPRTVCYDPDCVGVNKKRHAPGRKDIVLKGSKPRWRG